jgi:hypothetical protein
MNAIERGHHGAAHPVPWYVHLAWAVLWVAAVYYIVRFLAPAAL